MEKIEEDMHKEIEKEWKKIWMLMVLVI